MKLKKVFNVLSVLVILGLLLAACAPAAVETPAEEMPATTDESAATDEAPTAEATEEAPITERRGGWLDEIVFSVV